MVFKTLNLLHLKQGNRKFFSIIYLCALYFSGYDVLRDLFMFLGHLWSQKCPIMMPLITVLLGIHHRGSPLSYLTSSLTKSLQGWAIVFFLLSLSTFDVRKSFLETQIGKTVYKLFATYFLTKTFKGFFKDNYLRKSLVRKVHEL